MKVESMNGTAIMGFKNSPHKIQRAMNNSLDEFRGNEVEILNDIVINKKRWKESCWDS